MRQTPISNARTCSLALFSAKLDPEAALLHQKHFCSRKSCSDSIFSLKTECCLVMDLTGVRVLLAFNPHGTFEGPYYGGFPRA